MQPSVTIRILHTNSIKSPTAAVLLHSSVTQRLSVCWPLRWQWVADAAQLYEQYCRSHLSHILPSPSQWLRWYQIILFGDKGTCVNLTNCPELLLGSGPAGSQASNHAIVTLYHYTTKVHQCSSNWWLSVFIWVFPSTYRFGNFCARSNWLFSAGSEKNTIISLHNGYAKHTVKYCSNTFTLSLISRQGWKINEWVEI